MSSDTERFQGRRHRRGASMAVRRRRRCLFTAAGKIGCWALDKINRSHHADVCESERRMSYTLERAEEMARALRTLPAMDESKRRLSKQAVVKHLVAEIAALQKRGYTIEQVVESLQGVGFTITTPTLKSYPFRSGNTRIR